MMNLEEAIEYHETIAKEHELLANKFEMSDENRKSCLESVAEARQFVELLRELKKYRVAHYKLRDMDYEYDFNSMFGDNPMYYSEKVWDLFGDIDARVEYEVMG